MDLDAATDAALLRRFQDSGDRVALSVLFERHRNLAYRVALGVLRSPADAEDAAQDAFLNLLKYAPRVRTEGSLAGLVARMATRAAQRLARASGRRLARDTAWASGQGTESPDPAEVAEDQETRRAVRAAVDCLDQGYRLPVILHYIEHLSTQQTAEALGISHGAARTRLSRAVSRLRESLRRAGYALPAPAIVAALEKQPVEAAPATLAARLEEVAAAATPAPAGWLGAPGGALVVKAATTALIVCVLIAGAAALRQGPPAPIAATESMPREEKLYNEALGSAPERRVALLKEALQLRPGEVRYRVALGDAYALPAGIMQGGPEGKALSLEDARKAYEQAAKDSPRSALPHLRLADMDWEGSRAAAVAHLDRAIALEPDNALALYQRALAHLLAGEDDQGRRCLVRARACAGIRYPLLLPTAPMDGIQASACAAVLAHQHFACVGRWRDLARQIVRVASDFQKARPGDTEAPRELLIDGQRFAFRLMDAGPHTLISLLMGIACDSIISRRLEPILYARAEGDGILRLSERGKSRDALRDQAKAIQRDLTKPGTVHPWRQTWVWRDEGQMVAQALANSGLKVTIDEP